MVTLMSIDVLHSPFQPIPTARFLNTRSLLQLLQHILTLSMCLRQDYAAAAIDSAFLSCYDDISPLNEDDMWK
jgi:hypothetical protein